MDIEKYYSDIKAEIEKLKTEQAVRTEKIKRLAEELGLAMRKASLFLIRQQRLND